MMLLRALGLAVVLLLLHTSAEAETKPRTSMVEVQSGVRLEVLDWGGEGPPLVFLAGYGQTAHSFEGFAERFTSRHHVYAITRRGFGNSSRPPPSDENFTVERLAADVVAVIDHLGLERPVLAGHSVAGQELSEIGTAKPHRIGGLIYLDAANSQAFYGPRSSVLYPVAGEVRRDLERLISAQPSEARRLIAKLQVELPRLQRGLEWYQAALGDAVDAPQGAGEAARRATQDAVIRGARIHGPLSVPVLSLVAAPPRCAPNCEDAASRLRAQEAIEQAEDFERGMPQAQVVRIPYAGHFIWKTDGETVEREMKAFLAALPSK